MELDLYSETHCDDCNDIVHNHFRECPACRKKDAATTEYGPIYEMEEGDTIGCEECGAEWKLVKKGTLVDGHWVEDDWKRIEENK